MVHILLVIIYITFISLGLPDSLLGATWPSMYEVLNVPIFYAGMISALITIGTIISSLLSGRVVRKFGTGLTIAISVGMTATALFGFSLSRSFIALCLWAIPYGLGAGAVDAALNNFVALHYKAKHMNYLHSFWGVGATLGPYIMGLSLTGNLGWYHGYRTISLIQIALTMILIISLPMWKKSPDQKIDTHNVTPHVPYKAFIHLPIAKHTLVAFFCYSSVEQITGLWGSSYMVLKKGIPPQDAASFIALYFLGITVGRFVSGLLTSALATKNIMRLGEGLITLGVIIIFFSTTNTALLSGFVLIGLGCAPIFPSLLHQTPEKFGKQASISMMGLQMASAYLGATISPPLAGYITEKIGITIYPIILLLFTAIMIVLIELSNRTIHSHQIVAGE